ncbi:MAG: N,N-dimethylformamidase beta subunit family domain-containing protein [Pseudomonadota bacterium]
MIAFWPAAAKAAVDNIAYWELEDWSKHPERSVIGYCWPWTARPGETVDFKVSTYTDEPYEVDLVRVRRGNMWPAQDMLRETEIPAPFSGAYPGRRQHSAPGSFVEIPSADALESIGSFTVQTFVMPKVVLKEGETYRHYANVSTRFEGFGLEQLDGEIAEQTLVARWDAEASNGWSLALDRIGRPMFKVADASGTLVSVVLDTSLLTERWYLVSATYDADARRIRVASEFIEGYAANEYAICPESAVADLPAGLAPTQSGPLRFGAVSGQRRGTKRRAPEQVLNGRLDSVRLSRGSLTQGQIRVLSGLVLPDDMAASSIGFWDFAPGIGTTEVHDLSPNALNGETINAPYRGVVGVRWDGTSNDWTKAPNSYGACHFHDDDLVDAEWDTDFSYQIPADLPSGIYAAKIRHGEFIEHIPFFVAPPKGRTSSRIAFLASTASYCAYANFDELIRVVVPTVADGADGQPKITKEVAFHPSLLGEAIQDSLFTARHRREMGGGVYRIHTGGDPVWHATQKVPSTAIKLATGYTKLTMDSLLLDWLEHEAIDVDVITDDLMQTEGLDLLKNYTVVISGHHPEYYSGEMLDAVESFTDQGGRFMYLGGNGLYWNTAFHREISGLIEVRKIVSHEQEPYWIQQERINEFSGKTGSLWSLSHRPPEGIVGVGFQDVTLSSLSKPYRRQPGSMDPRAAFIFEGIGDELLGDFGYSGGGAAGMEVDNVGYRSGSPSHTLVLATSTDFDRPWGVVSGIAPPKYNLIYPSPTADLAFFETPNGGAVFSVGSMSYIGSLGHNDYDNNIARLTGNVLRRFADPAPFSMPELS